MRLEHIWQRVKETANLDKTSVPLSDDSEFDFVPLFGLGVVFELAKGIEAYTNISQSYRPKLFAEAVPLGTNEVINGDLKEGFAWQYDFGLRGNPVSFFHWDIDYFLLSFQDQIGTVGNSVQNVGDALHQGVELAAEIDFVGAYDYFKDTDHANHLGSFSPFVALTLLDAEFTAGPNDGLEPQYTPPYNLRFGMTYRWRERVKLSFLSTFVGDHFADDAKTVNRRIPSYKVWDLTAEVNLLKNIHGAFDLSLFGGISNLFDEEYYARITGTGIDPAYERNIYGGVKVELG
jgi:Fe(3+) dicitrate transport protein